MGQIFLHRPGKNAMQHGFRFRFRSLPRPRLANLRSWTNEIYDHVGERAHVENNEESVLCTGLLLLQPFSWISALIQQSGVEFWSCRAAASAGSALKSEANWAEATWAIAWVSWANEGFFLIFDIECFPFTLNIKR